jgi:lysophospholipase L1-like esterase
MVFFWKDQNMFKILYLIFIVLVFTTDANRILIIGDSISTYDNGWQEKLCERKGLNCTNLSLGGKRTDWMLATLRKELRSNISYTQIIIYGGVNDIFSYVPIDTAVNNVKKMIVLSKELDIKPIIIIGYNPNTIMFNTWVKDKQLESKLRNRYIEYQIKLMKLDEVMIVPMVPTQTSDTDDGIHLNSKGHKTFYNWIANYF